MHPLHQVDFSTMTDQTLQAKLGEIMAKMNMAGAYNNAPLYNQLFLLYEQYKYESMERIRINQDKMMEKVREKQGLPGQEPPGKNLTLD